MATILWEWKRLVDDFDPDEIFSELSKFIDFDTDVTILEPRALWKGILGPCKLNGEYYTSNEKPTMPYIGMVYDELRGLRYTNGQPRHLISGTDPDRNKFNINKWHHVVEEAVDAKTILSTFSLKWFAQYRLHMRMITPFADYCFFNKSANGNVDVRLYFYEELVVESFQDAVNVGMYDPNADSWGFVEDIIWDGAGIYNEPLLCLPKVTHFFIDLDYLIKKCDQNNYPIPDGLRLPDAKPDPVPSFPKDKSSSDPLPELIVDVDSSFPLMTIAPLILDRINRDPEILSILENVSKRTCRLKIIKHLKGLCSLDDDQLSILLTVLLPKDKRLAAKGDLRPQITTAIKYLWDGDGIDKYWLSTESSQPKRAKALEGMLERIKVPCGRNEVKDLLALISPNDLESWCKITSPKKWEGLRIELLSLNPQRLVR